MANIINKKQFPNFYLTNGRNLNVHKEVHGRVIYFTKSERVQRQLQLDQLMLSPLYRKEHMPKSYSSVCI